MRKHRDSNYELLRIIAMYMIVLIHANVYLGEFASDTVIGIYNPLVNGICNVGVTLFILISGYYRVSFEIRKVTKLECKMITYSMLAFALTMVVYGNTLGFGDKVEMLIKAIFPFTTREHWFYSCYVLIVLFSGFIDRLIETLDRKMFSLFLVMMICCFSFLPTIMYFEIVQDNGKGIVQMFMVYMIGRYLRIYQNDIKRIKKPILLIFALAMWIINAISFSYPLRAGGIYHTLCKDNSITNLVLAVSIFLLFKDVRFSSIFVNSVAKYIFAVFALNYVLVDMMFDYLINVFSSEAISNISGVAIMLMASLSVLLGCIFIGIIRDFLFGKLDGIIAELVERVVDNLSSKVRGASA